MAAISSNYIQGKHPYLKSYLNCPDQVINPIDDKLFSFWDSVQNYTFIYHLRHLHNDLKSNKIKFPFNPKETMFNEEVMNVIAIFDVDCSLGFTDL